MSITLDGTNGITTPDLESSGPVTGTTGTFSGAVSGTTGTFSGLIQAAAAGVRFNDTTVQTTAATAPTTATVLSATAGATAGAVGSYAFLNHTSSADYVENSTLAGASLRYAAVATYSGYYLPYNSATVITNGISGLVYGGTVSGTWRCMGVGTNVAFNLGCSNGSGLGSSLWLRIS